MRSLERACMFLVVMGLAALGTAPAYPQVNSVDLSGQVVDPQGAAVPGATVTVKNTATSVTRTTQSDSTGTYRFVGLPPGKYELTVEAKGLARLVAKELTLTVGKAAEFDAHMTLQAGKETVIVTEATELIETHRTAVAETVDLRSITNLPINGRNYINFTLLNSQSQRDSAPSIGAAPTSGINFQGQRARSNEVSVDGADAVDNSVNGIRATVSQEAVQEFQLIISNYMPEFGRATGGVVNIVTKAGSNEVHGDVFGYLRNKNIQARNPFSVQSVQTSPTSFTVLPVKQGFTRVQAGATLGGPIQKDKTFYFFSYETTRRQETGFTNIGSNNFGLVPASICGTGLLMTPGQATFYQNGIAGTGGCGSSPLVVPAFVTGAASAVALFGNVPGGPTTFPLPINCTPGVNCTAANVVPLPASFKPLSSLIGNYPVKEKTQLWSGRLDHVWNQRNSTFVRVSATPSFVTGIQVNAQNQNFGQNAGSRTSLRQTRDFALVAEHVTAFSNSVFNEFHFQFARHGEHYGFSQLPGGSDVAVNITGFAFFGREPFSTVDRIERRFQGTDSVSWLKGKHTIKTGGDINLIQIRSKKTQIFELNFGGLYNFGAISSGFLGPGLPTFSAVQAYGLGIPQFFIQGIGNSNRPFDNKVFAYFIQDSWRIHPRLTLNYGVRYDIELIPTFQPGTALNAIAEPALNIVEGIPHDSNNWAPRFALAWDPRGNGNTVIRAGYGIFYDHPLLAVAFDSTTAEGALSTQLITFGGAPTGAPFLANPLAFNAASIFQGVLNQAGTAPCGPAGLALGYLPSQQRFDPKCPNSLFVNETYIAAGIPLAALPFTLHVAKNYQFGYAQQGNLTVEQKLGKDFKLSLSYTYTHGLKLNRPRNINPTNASLLTLNFRNCLASGLGASNCSSDPLGVAAPVGPRNTCRNISGGGSAFIIAPGVLAQGFAAPNCPAAASVGFIGTAAVFNFFRLSGPNPSFASLFPAGYGNATTPGSLVGVAALAGYPTGIPNVEVPFGDVDQQESSGNSVYHGLTVAVSKRFARHFEFLSSYTWSHAIDDSTDLQTLLVPQDSRFPDLERGNSTFDQRHRWVTSAVFESPYKRSDSGFWHKFLADFIVSPIIEVSSGRPFTVLTGTDFLLQFSSNTVRPSVLPPGTTTALPTATSPFIPGVAFTLPTVCPQLIARISPPFGCRGNLGRNQFTRPGFASADLRISRKLWFNEKWNLEFITDVFNLSNRFNAADVNPLCNPLGGATCAAGQPTAALDPRQFQFALKINW